MATSDSPKVEFVQNHRPAMESGNYRIKVEHSVSGGSIPDTVTYTSGAAFAVTGARFGYLTAEDVYATFPAAGHTGDFQNVLPHVTLTRSTLPWERTPDGRSTDLPWLCVILIRDSDVAQFSDRPQPKVITLRELGQRSAAKFPEFELEPSQHPDDKVTVVDIPQSLLTTLMPRKSDLALLAHVRQPKNADGSPAGDELATVFCNRLPQASGSSTAYLVSVEGRYPDGDSFDLQGATGDTPIRLVCLQSFTFSCPDEQLSFTKLLCALDQNTLRPATTTGDPDADSRLSAGYTAMPHRLRQGDWTVSWYRGPLVPGRLSTADADADVIDLPARAADGMLRYESSTALFDVSYAAAWNIGRMLTLRDQGVSTALYNWKRSTTLSLWQDELAIEHLPLTGSVPSTSVPPSVESWFRGLTLLQGIPFNYLVPDEGFLPVESIRFFRVDPHWIECLLDGAFSIGRVTGKDMGQDRPSTSDLANLSGVLLRSSVVSGWPGLLVDGYAEVITETDTFVPSHPSLPLLRMERLSPNVLLCLFDGDLNTVDIHLAPETMHFGIEPIAGGATKKKLRGEHDVEVAVPLLRDPALGVVDIAGLAGNIQTETKADPYSSAQFALDMVEGVQKVRFTTKDG